MSSKTIIHLEFFTRDRRVIVTVHVHNVCNSPCIGIVTVQLSHIPHNELLITKIMFKCLLIYQDIFPMTVVVQVGGSAFFQ